MKKLDRLVKAAMVQADTKAQIRKKEVFERMTTEQLSELVNGNPSDERIKEILAAVDGLVKKLFPDAKVKETAPKDGFLHTVLTIPKPKEYTK